MNIANLNKLKNVPNSTPTYDPDPSNRAMYYIFDHSDKLIIWAEHDNNYQYWVSETSVNDVSINEEILRYIANSTDNKIISKYDGDAGEGYTWRDLYQKYKRYFFLNENFTMSANDIRNDYLSIKEKNKLFENDLNNVSFLKNTLTKLSLRTGNIVSDYKNALPLIKEIESLDYLICSDNDEIRQLYHEIQEQKSDLYGGAMSIMR